MSNNNNQKTNDMKNAIQNTIATQEAAMKTSPFLLRDICNMEESKGIERGNYTAQDVLMIANIMKDSSAYSGHAKRLIRTYS